MKYKDLVELGFERYEMNCSVHQDKMGFDDFFLFMENKQFTFYWTYSNPEVVELRRMKKSNILNVILIDDMETLKSMLSFVFDEKGNSGEKKTITVKKVSRVPMLA